MKIEHIAIWVQDIDKVCEFYRKYFGGVVHPIYHNPAKQFTSRFVTFESGARLEIMHRPDIDANVGTVTSLTFHVEHSEHLGFAHLSFSVGSKEEVDRLTRQMTDDGIQVIGEPRTTGDGYYESVVLDPEGNRVEITV
ncbi:lactoylglutathione lyase [Fibrobacter sp. UWOV1]|uniref:VOC family protein n=1 Tax=Fibrobacter sp. UWOV1 TaxID=1896215 RepID=UPI0009245708|nr:VOC family protein [Fibrobacter sp. UWOV1]SHL71363.1 lactoylglutathione lyase [Fibrobacter sp. UWOV1]